MKTHKNYSSLRLASYSQTVNDDDGVAKAYQLIFKKMIELRADRASNSQLKKMPPVSIVTGGLTMCECI